MVKMTDDSLAVNVGKRGEYTIAPVAFGGHCVYVRKCLPGQQFGDDSRTRAIGGIVLPDQTSQTIEFENTADKTEWVEVLAKGPRVGKPCMDESHRRNFERAIWFGDGIKVGMICHVKYENGIGIIKSPINPGVEFFIEESWLDAYCETGNGE